MTEVAKWTKEDIEQINSEVLAALDDTNSNANEHAVNAFRLMRAFGLGIECLTPTNTGEPKDMSALNDGPLPKRASADDQDGKTWGEYTIPFGKYKGDTLENVLRNDFDYFRWMATKAEIISDNLKEALDGLWQVHGK